VHIGAYLEDVVSNKAAQLLRDEEPEIEEIVCVECGRKCPAGVDLCPHCGQIPKLVLLSELGKNLPIGLLDVVEDDKGKREVLRKSFDVIGIDWNLEREISEIWKKVQRQPDATILDYLVCVLVYTVTVLAGESFKKHKPERRMAVLNNMFGGDIFYMYTMARIASLGDIFTIKDIECPKCKHVFNFPVDLNSLEIATRKDPKSLYKWIDLRDGFKVVGEVRKRVKIRPATFLALSHAPDTNETEMFRSMVKDVVVEIDGLGEGSTMTDEDVAQLLKWDMSIFAEEVDLSAGGPEWSIEGNCPKCDREFDHMIDWRYSNFFRQSSRSSQRRRRSRR